MKRKTVFACALSIGLGFFMTPGNAVADHHKTGDKSANPHSGTSSGLTIRAGEMMGMNIQNSSEENVGEVSDLVIDATRGKVRYVAVTYGGFLGIGDEMFAVPYEAFQCRQDPDDPDHRVLVLDVTKEKMKGASGFDQNHWPNFADHTFTSDLDQRYGVRRTARYESRAVSDAADQVAHARGQSHLGDLDDLTSSKIVRVSELNGLNIQNSKGVELGEIKDVVVDAGTGKIRYAAVTYGGFLGVGDKMFAVPFDAFETRIDPENADDYVLVLDVTEAQLEGDSGFDQDHWPDFANHEFTRSVDARYGINRTE